MYSKFTGVMFVVTIVVLTLLVSCIPEEPIPPVPATDTPTPDPTTVTPTPTLLPPGDWLSWAIRFQAKPGSFGVEKLIGVYDGALGTLWEPDITLDLTSDCEEHGGEIFYGDEYVEFDPGEYIRCEDIDLRDYVSAPLDDYIGYEPCQFGHTADGERCMQTTPLLLQTTVGVPVSTTTGTYPIFSYPQSFPDDNQAIQLSTTFSDTIASQSIDFGINYLVGTNIVTFTEQVWWDTSGVFTQPLTFRIERHPVDLNHIVFSFPSVSPAPDPISFEVPEAGEFEFSTRPVVFYFGDMPDGEMMPAPMRLYRLLFDPSDSCGGCQ